MLIKENMIFESNEWKYSVHIVPDLLSAPKVIRINEKQHAKGMHSNYYTEGMDHHFYCSENTYTEITGNWSVTLQQTNISIIPKSNT